MKVVIFAGGVGTRLWPLSRKHTPKQFEKIIGDKSTLQLAVDRVWSIFSPENIYVASGERYKDIIYEQLPEIPKENIILEPEMRDVGPAVGLVTAILSKISPDEPFIILWSDHLVKEEELFRKVINTVGQVLTGNKNKIVFMGHTSRFASQNLGWIEIGNKADEINGISLFEFKSFHYRPELRVAEKFHDSPKHYWNPGYFGTTAGFLFSLYEKFNPKMAGQLKKIQDSWGTKNYSRVVHEIYPKLEKVTFDNLILEKMDPSNGFVIGADFGWSDVGAWESLKEALSEHKDDNVTRGKVILRDSKDTLVFNHTSQMITGIDLSELLIINTEDVLLICPKNSVPKIKKLVESLSGTENDKLM